MLDLDRRTGEAMKDHPARPPSFDAEYEGEWQDWVMVNGLVPLPLEVGMGQSVPVARWNVGECGAVQSVSWRDDGEPELEDDIQPYEFVDGEWVACNGSGGSNWWSPRSLAVDFRPTDVVLGGLASVGDCCAASGIAGRAGTRIELTTGADVLTAPIESPLGAFVVAFDLRGAASVRVLDDRGSVLHDEAIEVWTHHA
jgi:hypothetical protein